MTKIKNPKKIRLRFPPSPTGPLHIGNARTILFNYLFAKQNNGETVLRIEDTDTERSKLEWVQNIIDELHWLGLDWNEGPDVGGPHGPYKQTQRTDIYKKYLQQLLEEKKAYYCVCTPEELEEKRQKQTALGIAPKYDGKCRDAGHQSGVIRLKVAEKKVKFTDLIRGDIELDTALLGDIVIARSFESALYHFAVVVDDYEMEITHIIRGEDHISNTPKHIVLQEALGFYTPTYAHLPLMLNADKSKMSKRAGDVALSDYHKNGYLPEAIVNFIVLLGWNPGTEKEMFSLDELVKEFSLEKVQKAGAIFNVQRLDFINSVYIKEKPINKLTELCMPYLADFDTAQFTKHQLEQIIELHRPRLKKLSEISTLADYFFQMPAYDKKMLAWKEMREGDVKKALEHSAQLLTTAKNFDQKSLEALLVPAAEKFNAKNRGYLLWPLRVALSGKEASAGPFEIAEILGKEKTLERIYYATNLN